MRLSGGCQHHPGLPHPGDAPGPRRSSRRRMDRYGLLAEEVGVGEVGTEAVGVGVGHGRPSREFRQPPCGLDDGVGGGGDTAGEVEGAPGGGAVVDVDVSGTGSGFGPLGPP